MDPHAAPLASRWTVETTPAEARRLDARAHLPEGTRVAVTWLPDRPLEATVEASRRLRDQGMRPMPHLVARALASRAELEGALARLRPEAVVVVAGSLDRSQGPFDQSLDVLETGSLQAHGVRLVGVAGHPEGHPDVDDAALDAALRAKAAWAARTGVEVEVITQFAFEAAPVLAWVRRVRALGVELPVRVGLPGPATVPTLVRYAVECGVGPSLRFLTRQARDAARLVRVVAPDRLLAELGAAAAAEPALGLAGVHLYPFGGLPRTAAWIRSQTP